jgi:Cd2+/Zn2+-exporting ATPase
MLFGDPKVRWLLWAALCVLLVEAMSYFIPAFPPKPLQWAFFLLAAWLARAVLMNGARSLLKFRFSSISLLISVAAVGAVWLRQPLEAAVVLSLFALSESLEEHGFKKSYAALEGLLDKAPKQAEVEGRGLVLLEQVIPGEIVWVKPGSLVPVDGNIIEGVGLLDEASITGEPLPVSRTVGEKVFAGSLNQQGFLKVKVLHAGKDSTLQRIVQMTYEATERKLKFQSFVERFAVWYTPLIMFIAAAMVIWAPLAGQPFALWLERALTLLVIACPCALTMATPVAVFAAVSAASRAGIVVKGGRPLEALAELRVLAVDKTRTLTEGKPWVSDIVPLRGWTQAQVLAAAAGLEALTTHPVAKAVLEKAAAEGVTAHGIKGFQELPGKGVQGDCVICRDSHHCLGKPSFAEAEHGIDPTELAEVERLQGMGRTVIVLSDGHGAVGLLGIEDKLRPEAPQAIAALRGLGVQVVMLTGDHAQAAAAVAASCGIQDFKAGLLPQDKALAIRDLGPNCGMLGDGVNDAPALAAASVGIAMGAAGSDLAVENAEVALMGDNLEKLAPLMKLGRRTLNIIRFNSWLAVGAKLLVLVLALLGYANLDLAILSDVGLTVLVIWNGLRLADNGSRSA